MIVAVAAKIQNVPLRDPQVFEKLPRRVRRLGGFDSMEFRGPASKGLLDV